MTPNAGSETGAIILPAAPLTKTPFGRGNFPVIASALSAFAVLGSAFVAYKTSQLNAETTRAVALLQVDAQRASATQNVAVTMIQISAQVLRDPETPATVNLHRWAVAVIDSLAPVKLTAQAKEELRIQGIGTGKAIIRACVGSTCDSLPVVVLPPRSSP